MHHGKEKCKRNTEWNNDYEEKEPSRAEDEKTTRDDEYAREENIEYIRNKIKSIEKCLEKEHDAMTELLVKIGLKTVQQRSWDNIEDNVERF